MIQITYQKRNGEIFQRIRNTYLPYRVGDTTSMGWKVLDIKYKYGKRYYDVVEYDKIIDTKWKRRKKLFQLKNNLKEMYRYLTYLTTLFIFLKVFIFISFKTI